MKIKTNFFSRNILKKYSVSIAGISAISSLYFIAVKIPDKNRIMYFISATAFLILLYLFIWIRANLIKSARLNINNSSLVIKVGDIFKEKELKAIAFNEYFDTKVDDLLIARNTLNGKYIEKLSAENIIDLDKRIIKDRRLKDRKNGITSKRTNGKKQRYNLGSIFVDGDYLLIAFTKFDENNRAVLTLKEYVACLINFWEEVDQIYGNRSVSLPLLGAGITRFKDAEVQPQELLKIIIWTFKISRIKFKHPAKATIVIHSSMVDKINFYDLTT